jgi:hypothetical protein
MACGARLLLFVALAAVGTDAAYAQSTLAPTAPAIPSQIYSGSSPYARPLSGPSSQQAGNPTGQIDTAGQQPGATPYQGIGITTDKIIWYPSVTGAVFYDDNVFARHTNRQGDWAAVVRPEMAWRTNNWANLEMAGSYFVEKRAYHRFNSEDQFNGGAVVGGTLRPGENTQVITRLQYLHAHEDRGTSDTINSFFAKPIRYDQLEAAGVINQRYGRFWTSVGGAAAFVSFGTGTIAGFPVPQDYRTGAISSIPFRAGYVVAPLTSVFVEVSANQRDFRVNEFDSHGWRVVGGALFEPGPGSRIKGEIYGGWMTQSYGFGFQDVSTFTYGSALAFLLMPNLTAVLVGRRDAREASLSGGIFAHVPGDGVSVVESVVAGRVDWAVRPDLVLGAGLAYIQDDYLGANRSDHAVSPLASLKYFPNRHLTLGFDYRYLNFDSTGFGVLNYYRNVYLFSANLRL